MTLLAAHLNDAGLLFTDGERILCREPGFALLEDDGLTTGREAWANASLKPRRNNEGCRFALAGVHHLQQRCRNEKIFVG